MVISGDQSKGSTAPLPHKPQPGRVYKLKSGDRIYIRSPRSVKDNARWVAAVVKRWDNKTQSWRVRVVQENLVESWWEVPLIKGKWKRRRKLTYRERERRERANN